MRRTKGSRGIGLLKQRRRRQKSMVRETNNDEKKQVILVILSQERTLMIETSGGLRNPKHRRGKRFKASTSRKMPKK